LLEEVHEDAQSSLALELKKMRKKARITISSNSNTSALKEIKLRERRELKNV